MTWMSWVHRMLIALTCAEGLWVLTSVDKITIVLKRPNQRTAGENKRVFHGLFRELLGELFVFVPVSVVVAMIVLRPFMVMIPAFPQDAVDGLLGIISYPFPYKALKHWVVRASVRFIREAADVVDENVLEETNDEEDGKGPRDDSAA